MGKNVTFMLDGKYLKQVLSRKKLSHEEAARQCGINKNTVNKAANGGLITMDNFLKLCNVLQIHPGYLFKSEQDGVEGRENEYRPSLSSLPYTETQEFTTHTAQEEEVAYYPSQQPVTGSLDPTIYKKCCEDERIILRRLNKNYLQLIEQQEKMIAQYRRSLGID